MGISFSNIGTVGREGIDRFIYELRGENIISELNIQFVIADGTIQIKDQASK